MACGRSLKLNHGAGRQKSLRGERGKGGFQPPGPPKKPNWLVLGTPHTGRVDASGGLWSQEKRKEEEIAATPAHGVAVRRSDAVGAVGSHRKSPSRLEGPLHLPTG
jgi:hypothetical protein